MKAGAALVLAAFLTAIPILVAESPLGPCDHNPHSWSRTRRCDDWNPKCPLEYRNCTVCEGIGGIASSDVDADIKVPNCEQVASPSVTPPLSVLPAQFVNTGFYEVQIFGKHDPFCLAQIPGTSSNGTHCYKPQEGSFYYDSPSARILIDYVESRTTFPWNMTERFHHEGNRVHPQITRFGDVNLPVGGICPCIDVNIGILAPAWLTGARYVGRERIGVEYIWESMILDHWVQGPHHAWVDPATQLIVRLWQPFNGLEVFSPGKWVIGAQNSSIFDLSPSCELGAKACIPSATSSKSELSTAGANLAKLVVMK